MLGRYIRKQYGDLFPSKKKTSLKGKKDKKMKKSTYKVRHGPGIELMTGLDRFFTEGH
jgi:hypothetical protein